MGYLADTNVISEIGKRRPNPGVMAFLQGREILLSCIVFAELNYGAHRLKHDRAKWSYYVDFIERFKRQYEDAIVPVSLEIAELSGRMRASQGRRGRVLDMADALIAATALHTGSVLVTRNTKDFAELGIALLNPFSPD